MEHQSQVELAVFFTVLGGFIGAALNPFADHLFAMFFKTYDEKYSTNQGLVLLGAANATWLVGYNVGRILHSNCIVILQGLLYLVAIFLFIGSYTQFSKGNLITLDAINNNLIFCLIIGNLLWLLGESWELLEEIQLENISYINGKYATLSFSVAFFALGTGNCLIKCMKKILTKYFRTTG